MEMVVKKIGALCIVKDYKGERLFAKWKEE